MHFTLIANPISGRGQALRRARAVADRLVAAGRAAEVLVTTGPGDAQRLAAGATGDIVVACGGDGTLNQVLEGVLDRGARPVGLVPAGVGNVVAKEFSLPRRPRAIADLLIAGGTRRLDRAAVTLGARDRRQALFLVSAGFDAEVVRRIAAGREGPLFRGAYLRHVPGAVRAADHASITVRVDGRVLVERARYAAIANLSSYGGPFRIVPEARPDDGLLDVLALSEPLAPRVARLFFAALASSQGFAGQRDVVRARGHVIEFLPVEASATPVPFQVPIQVDGDPAGMLPARIEIQPASWSLVVP